MISNKQFVTVTVPVSDHSSANKQLNNFGQNPELDLLFQWSKYGTFYPDMIDQQVLLFGVLYM